MIFGHGVQCATFFFNCPPSPEEPQLSLARCHRWSLPKASFAGGTQFTVEKGSLVFTFATCGWTLRRDEDGPAWMEWAAMGHAPHVAPASVAGRWSEIGWCSGRRQAAEWSTHVGAWTMVRIMGRYVLRAHVAHTHRVRTVYVPRTHYIFRAYALTCRHVRVGEADRTCWGSNMWGLP